jgi:hypothetical protein
VPIDPNHPSYDALTLLVKDVTFDRSCRLAPILLKGPDYNRRDCPADTTAAVTRTPEVRVGGFFRRLHLTVSSPWPSPT